MQIKLLKSYVVVFNTISTLIYHRFNVKIKHTLTYLISTSEAS